MRVISAWRDVDVDYESNNFMIVENNSKDYDIDSRPPYPYLVVCLTPQNQKLVMGSYTTVEKAQDALSGMSSNYTRYLITDHDNYMQMTDALDCELDKPFNKIEIKEMKATVYQFPIEEE